MRVNIDHQISIGGAFRSPVRIERVHARILQLNDHGKLSLSGRLREIPVDLRSHWVESKDDLLDARDVGLDRCPLGPPGYFRIEAPA